MPQKFRTNEEKNIWLAAYQSALEATIAVAGTGTSVSDEMIKSIAEASGKHADAAIDEHNKRENRETQMFFVGGR
jgi:hypothetical protein